MTDQERGAYTPPTDEALSFDARQPVRGARPFPITLVIGAVLLIGLVTAIFMFYRSGVRQSGQAPQAVGTPVAEMKVAPPAESQPQDPAAGLEIYQEDAHTPGAPGAGAPQFTAPPEQPQARTARPPVVVAPPPAAAPTTPVTAGPALRPALPTAPPAAAAPVSVAPPPPVRPAPAAKPAPKVATVTPPAAAPAKAAPAKAEAPAAAPAKSAGGAVVQIGAYSSQALADKGLTDAMATAGGGHGRSVERIEKDGHTLFRTAVTGFASRADASAYCGKLKAAGKACFVR